MKPIERELMFPRLTREFHEQGFTILSDPGLQAKARKLDRIFEENFQRRFSKNIHANRNLIKAFGRSPSAISLFNQEIIFNFCKWIKLEYPIFCGPLVTHYTSRDSTGNGYGLPYHQDYASMGGSLNSLVLWSNLKNITSSSEHSINVITGMHQKGLLPGKVTEEGYVLERQSFGEAEKTITLEAGDVLIMSAFTPHRTYFGSDNKTYKLSLSIRLDDLNSREWQNSQYRSAYSTSVDRSLYKSTLNQQNMMPSNDAEAISPQGSLF